MNTKKIKDKSFLELLIEHKNRNSNNSNNGNYKPPTIEDILSYKETSINNRLSSDEALNELYKLSANNKLLNKLPNRNSIVNSVQFIKKNFRKMLEKAAQNDLDDNYLIFFIDNIRNKKQLNETNIPIIHYLIKMRKYLALKALIKAKADIDILYKKFSLTPLIYAASIDNPPIVEILLDEKADPNKPNLDGDTPLIVAVSIKSKNIVKLLLQYGANPNVRNNKGITPLIEAIKSKNNNLVKLLLDGGADPNFENGFGMTPIKFIATSYNGNKNDYEIIDLLREKGAKLLEKDKNLLRNYSAEKGRTQNQRRMIDYIIS